MLANQVFIPIQPQPAPVSTGFTDTQLQILKFIIRFRTQHPMGPCFDEIGAAIGRKKTATAYQVRELIRRDALRCEYLNFGGHPRVREGSLYVAPVLAESLTKGKRA